MEAAVNLDALFSSAKNDWETPDDLFEQYNRVHRFALDACAHAGNAKLPNYLGLDKGQNALTLSWAAHSGGRPVWCNPPYGRGVGAWVQKAKLQSMINDMVVVMLLPARTDTKWFHEHIYDRSLSVTVTFLRGRLKFKGAKSSAPFPSMIVEFFG